MPLRIRRLCPTRIVPILALALLVILQACAPVKTITVPLSQSQPIAPAEDRSLSGQAERAWADGNMKESERLYGILARNADTPKDTLPTVLERLVQAALTNRHAQAALDSLDQLRRMKPEVTATGLWQRQLGQALLLLPPADALRRAVAAAKEQGMPPTLRAQSAGVGLLLAPQQEKVGWMEVLNGLYSAADGPSRQIMERGLYSLMPSVAPAALAGMIDFSLPDTDQAFPWSVLLLEQARREAKKLPVAATTAAIPAEERLGTSTIFADPALRAEVMSGKFSLGLPSTSTALGAPVAGPQSGKDVPMASGCVVLALPTTGNFAAVGGRVAKGAELAKQSLATNGIQAEVIVLNTESPDWLNTLAGLPPHCTVVGGPLIGDAYTAAKAANILSSRVFFTFMSSLEGNDEGSLAWRFFSSPEDQVNAVLRVAQGAGVDAYGILYPEEPYGRRMADLFSSTAGSRVVATAGYAATDPQSWNGITRNLVGGHMRGDIPVSSAKFQGLFMPDSWASSAGLIPFLFFHGEDRLLLMGTALWEQGIGRTRLDPSNTALVIFPGGWNGVTPSAAASTLIGAASASGQTADYWMGLGYDFVRFGLAMNLTGPTSSADVTAKAQSAARMNWSIAPLSWTPDGKARQQMFVFAPTADGASIEIVNPDALRLKLEQVRARYQRRMGQ